MSKAVFYLLVLSLLNSCSKDKSENVGQCDTYLLINSTKTPRTSTISSGIKTIIDCYGPNLCYSFSGMEIIEKEGNVFEIKAKGKAPCGPAICLQAIYAVKDSATINIRMVGFYYLKFFNNDAATSFKTDTVVVN